jgi:type IV secretory pathway TrbF-like protein
VKVVVESPSWRMVALATIIAGSVLAGALLYIWEVGNV